MGYGGAPPWVYKKREQAMANSYQSQIARLEQRIKELEEENSRLKTQLEEFARTSHRSDLHHQT